MLPQPLGDRILVEQMKKVLESASIYVPDEAKGNLKRPKGTILAIGNGEEILKMELKLNDVVYFNEFSGEHIVFGETEYLLLRPDEVLAKD